MELQFLGATGTVTGSKYLMRVGSSTFRGATIAGGASTVRIHGQDIPVRAEIAILDTLSAHADGAEIVEWLRGFSSAPRQTFITHGEPAAADALRQRIERELHWSSHVPYYLESVPLG